MLNLDDPSVTFSKADEVVARLANERGVQVIVQPGVSRREIIDPLVQRLGKDAAEVHLPPLDDADAPLHGLLQSAAHLDRNAVECALNDAIDLRERTLSAARTLAEQGRVLVVWIPPSWRLPGASGEFEEDIHLRRAESVLGGWIAAKNLRMIVVVSSSSRMLLRRAAEESTLWPGIDVQPALLRPDALDDVANWGPYASFARVLRDALTRRKSQGKDVTVTPFQMRLLVGLIGLGEEPTPLLNWFSQYQKRPYALVQRFRQTLSESNRTLGRCVVRFLRARFPLPRDVAQSVAGIPAEHAEHLPLLTECIGQGGTTLEADESLRQELLGAQSLGGNKGDASTHIALANHHEKLDGARSPVDAWGHIVEWLEKTHHLGHSGNAGAERWSHLDLPTRELYWDRARSLSMEHREYVAAAELYRTCINRFDRRDAYSWHYLGYNLDCAGVRRKDAEHALREAVKLRPEHPWYNGRLVTFLIDQARFRDAEEEWRKALERMDPSGENVSTSRWLAREAHRWVVKAWLRFGEVNRARQVFDDIPDAKFLKETWFARLRHELEDAKEAIQLGESVYPSETLMDERWHRPQQLVSEHDPEGRPLRAWFPGRVVAVDEGGVHTALAVPHENPSERRIIARTLSAEEWKRYGFCSAAEAEGKYILVAIYAGPTRGEDAIRIIPVTHREFEPNEDDIRYATRYLAGAQG